MKSMIRRTGSQIKINKRLFALAAFTTLVASVVLSVSLLTDTYTIVDGDNEIVVESIGDNTVEILEEANIQTGAEDTIEVTEITNAEKTVNITRAYDVAVEKDGQTKYVKMSNGTVADALEKSETTLDEDDSLNVSTLAEVSPGMVITVENVAYTYITETKAIPYTTTKTESDELSAGEVETVKEGSEGLEKLTYKQKVVDGVTTNKELVSSTIEVAPVTAEQVVGTKEPDPSTTATLEVEPEAQQRAGATEEPEAASKTAPVEETKAAPADTDPSDGISYESVDALSTLTPDADIVLDASGVPLQYSEKITGKATAYTAGPGATTATGKKPQVGYVAVDPDVIPYGTEMYIRSADGKYIYGYAIAADTGGFVSSSDTVVDLYFDSESECYSFGRRPVEIYILE